MKTKKIIKKLKRKLRDPEYRYGWVSNIAMAYIDAEISYRADNEIPPFSPLTAGDKHEIVNNAANGFLRLLGVDSPPLWFDREAPPVGWVLVEERLPPSGEEVLLFYNSSDFHCIIMGAWFADRGIFEDMHDGDDIYGNFEYDKHQVTHWMPLPTNPRA